MNSENPTIIWGNSWKTSVLIDIDSQKNFLLIFGCNSLSISIIDMNFEKKLVLFESISLEKTVFLDNLSNWLI